MDEKSSGSQSPILSCVEPLWPPQWPPHILVETRRCKAPQACCDRAGLKCPPDWRAGAQSSHSLPKLGSDLLPGDTNRSDEFQLSPWFPGKSGSSWEGWIGLPCFPFSFALFSGKILSGIMMGISYLLSNLTLKFGLCKTQKRIGNSVRASRHSMYSLFLGDRAWAPWSQFQIHPPWLEHLLPATSTRGSSEHVSAAQASRKMQTRRAEEMRRNYQTPRNRFHRQ